MDDATPFLSICVPVYNAATWLTECLSSIERQTFEDYEVVIIDDGSTDDSPRIASEFASRSRNINVFQGRHQGALSARIEALRHARGTYILSLDADDYFVDGAFEAIAETLTAQESDILVFERQALSDGAFTPLERPRARSALLSQQRDRVMDCFFNTKELNNLWCKAIRQKLFDLAFLESLPAANMADDWLVSLVPMLRAERFSYLPQALYVYRVHGSSMTDSYDYDYPSTLALMHSLRLQAVDLGMVDADQEERSHITYLADCAKAIAYIPGKPKDCSRYRAMLEELRCNSLFIEAYRRSASSLPLFLRLPLLLLMSGHDGLLWKVKQASSVIRKRVSRR